MELVTMTYIQMTSPTLCKETGLVIPQGAVGIIKEQNLNGRFVAFPGLANLMFIKNNQRHLYRPVEVYEATSDD
jgi:hypothetical protein